MFSDNKNLRDLRYESCDLPECSENNETCFGGWEKGPCQGECDVGNRTETFRILKPSSCSFSDGETRIRQCKVTIFQKM